MKLGDVFVWETDQAKSYDFRRKYHVYICEAGWRDDGHIFLFISSTNYSGRDYPVRRTDYSFFTNDVSFVGCQSIVVYSEDVLIALNLQPVGRLQRDHLIGLRSAVADSETLEGWQITTICHALAAVF